MRVYLEIAAAALGFTAPLSAQTAPSFNQNGLAAHNTTVQAVPVEFPGFRSKTGNAPGDCAWKVFEGDSLLVPAGKLLLSGFESCVEDMDARTPLDHPDIHVYRASRDARGRLVPDFQHPLAKYQLGRIALPRSAAGNSSGFWRINWSLGQPASLPVSDALHDRPFAVCLMATPGESYASADGARLCLTASENYAKATQGSFSGFHLASSGRTALFDGTEKTLDPASPYKAGEIWVEAAFVEPILAPWCTSAVKGSASVQDLGVGSVWTDLASSGGSLGWRLESWQDAAGGTRHWAFLLLNLQGRPGTYFGLPGTQAGLLLNPADPALTLLVSPLGCFGPFRQDRPAGFPPDFWDGVYDTGPITVGPNPYLSGLDLWVGAVMVDMDRAVFAGASNTCVLRLR